MATDPSPAEPTRARPRGASRRDAAPVVEDLAQYLSFRIGSELYAVDVLETSEVLEYRAPTPVPRAPAWVAGMLNLRGKAIPVMDLAIKFGASTHQPGSSACIVVLELVIDDEPSQVGVIADDVPVVVQLSTDQIVEPPLFGTLVNVRYLRGMARLDGGLMLVLDAAGALTAQEATWLSQIDGGEVDASAELHDEPQVDDIDADPGKPRPGAAEPEAG